jgi:outer membrane protein OmpA-like peptidoglycan-associated protein
MMFIVIRMLMISGVVHPLSAQDQLIKSIYFGGGSWYVDDYQAKELGRFIDSLENMEAYEIIIHSHTDNIGGVDYNRWLSQMRSMAVYEQLIQHAIDPSIIHIRDFGLDNPLYDNHSYEGRIMNRRVDVIFQPVVF